MYPRNTHLFLSLWLACLAITQHTTLPALALVDNGYITASAAAVAAAAADVSPPLFAAQAAAIPEGKPMKSVPVHLLPRSDAGRQRTLTKFQPKNTIQLRFIDADKAAYYGACHHVDMNVELKSEDGQKTIESLNPFAFQHAVKSISCTTEESDGTVKTSSKDHHQHHLHIELDSQYADQARRWRLSAKNVFAIVIPHDFVDLKNNKACFEDLSPKAKSWVRDHPLETVVKLVKTPQFLDPQRPHRLTLTVVKTDIWSEMNREQSVKIAHRPLDEMIGLIFHKKRSTAEEDGPMWDFEHGLSGATENVSGEMNANNVNADLDQSSVKGYAQANMAWKQTCIKNIFTGNMNCAKWGISNSKISGMTQISHTAQIAVKTKNQGKQQNNQISSNHHHQQQRNAHLANANAPALRDDLPDPSDLNATQPLLTLTNINVTTPSFNLMTPIALMGFSVPGVFDMGASVGLGGAVKLAILVQASQDLVMNTGSATSCPWIIDWNGSFLDIPTIQFGTCSMPDSIKAETVMPNGDIGAKSRQTAAVSVGMTVSPSFSLGLKVFGITALSAGISSPISLGLDTLWDTDKTQQCPANNVAVSTEGSAGLQLVGGFFGFSKSIPVLQSPTLQTPSICIPHS